MLQKEEDKKSDLPDGIELINGQLIDRKSGGEYLRMNPEAIKVAMQNLKQDQDKFVPYDPEIEKYFDEVMAGEQWYLDYEQARKEFYLIWRNKIGRKPMVHKEDAWIIQNFVKWLIQDDSGEFDLDKGLLFCGIQGCGKSELMKAGVEFSNRFKFRNFKFKRIGDIFFELSEVKNWAQGLRPYLTGNWCFDDIAQMNEDLVVYSKLNIVEVLINYRVGRKGITLGTTNLSPGEVEKKYGKTVASRFNQIFEAVEFETDRDYRTL